LKKPAFERVFCGLFVGASSDGRSCLLKNPRQKKASDQAGWCFRVRSGLVGSFFGVVGYQRNQGILLSVGELAEALQQLTLVQGQLRAVQAHAQLLSQCAFLDKTLLQASNHFGVHAAMMIASHLGNAFTHPVWQTYDELVSRAAGINCLFQWAHIFDRLVQGSGFRD
jgi:hypothetical protein